MLWPNTSQYNSTAPADQSTMTLEEWCRSIGLDIDPPEVGVHRSNTGAGHLDAREHELFQDFSTISLAHRQSEGLYGYSSGMGSTEPYYQSAEHRDGSSSNTSKQALYQPTKPAHPQSNTPTIQQQQHTQAGPKYARFQNPSKVHKRLRSGRSVPPPRSDARWNIWTLGNLSIRHTNGGVTVKHLQQVLFNADGNKRTKYDYQGLMGLIVDRREASMGLAPEGWNAEQGWWVHFDM